ncbi:16S rRNA (uracil(1498)-N(3))-methyltransferase [Holzapfeliella sp. JNUCC 80]
MQHYFLDETLSINQTVSLPKDIAHRVSRVRRSKVDDEIEVVDSLHQVFIAKITSLENKAVEVEIVQEQDRQVELQQDVTLLVGMPKKEKAEWIIQKGTELGANAFVFFNSRYAVAKLKADRLAKKLDRLNTIAKQAAEQSRRSIVPEVKVLDKLSDLDLSEFDHTVVAYEEAAKQSEKSNLVKVFEQVEPNQKVLGVFGPEGGLAEEEVTTLVNQGATVAALGPRILRVETAPLYFLSALSYQTELNH